MFGKFIGRFRAPKTNNVMRESGHDFKPNGEPDWPSSRRQLPAADILPDHRRSK
jgi:hypothetical protein